MTFSNKTIRQSGFMLATFAVFCAGVPRLIAQPFPEHYLVEQDPIIQDPVANNGFAEVVAIDGPQMVVSEANKLNLFDQIDGVWTKRGDLNYPGTGRWYDAVLENGTLVASRSAGMGEASIFEKIGDHDSALNAWNTTDNSTGSGLYTRYGHEFSPADHALANLEGWTITVRARMIDDFGGALSCFFDVANDNDQRFLVSFDLDASNNLTVELGGLEIVTIPSNGTGWANYHTHELVYDPVGGTADYYFDGTKMNSAPWSPTAITGLSGVRFGNGSSGGKGSMNWNKVEFKTAQTDQVLALYDAGDAANTPVSLDPLDQDWIYVTSSGTSAGPVLADYHSIWEATARFFPTVLPTQFGSPFGFGTALALRGDTLFVGFPFDLDGSADAGTVRIFRKVAGEWTAPEMPGQPGIPEMLIPFDGNGQRIWGREYGSSLSVDGDTLIVGSRGDYRYYDGQAHVYLEDAGNWELEAELVEGIGQLPGFNEVSSVSIQGDRAAVATSRVAQNATGVAQVYERNGTIWTKVQNLVPAQTPNLYGGGIRIAHDGDFIVLVFADNESEEFFVVHLVFALNDLGNWVEIDRFEYADPRLGGQQTGELTDTDFDGTQMIVGIGEDFGFGNAQGFVVHTFFPYQHDVPALTKFVNELLYYPAAKASSSSSISEDDAAFRYRVLMYERDLANGINPVYDSINDHFGPADRDRAALAERELLSGLMHHPDSTALHTSLLDLFYDLARANTVVARNLSDRAGRAHFGLPIGENPANSSSGFIIDLEIPLYLQLLNTNRFALDDYFRLFTLGDAGPGQPPLGYTMFRDLVPTRGLMSAEFVDETNGGDLRPVFDSGSEMLFNGYKDAVAAFEMLRDQGRTALTLGRLLVSRDNPSDREQAVALVSSTIRYLLNHGNLVKGMFESLPPIGDQSGLAETIESWHGVLSDLEGLKLLTESNRNILGFADDFHFFVENYGSSAPAELQLFHSYDIFEKRLEPGPGNPTSQLEIALEGLDAAEASYVNYRGSEDQIAAQFTESSITYRDRLRDIVGVFPEDEDYSDDPTKNPGSLLDLQYRGIEIARNRIRRNRVEFNNLLEEVRIERNRAAEFEDAVVDFGERQAKLTKMIGHFKAAQAVSDALAQSFSVEKIVTGQAIGFAANAVVQGASEEGIALLEAGKEELAAQEQARLDGINSEARVNTLLLGLKTIAVDSTEQRLLLTQELNRLTDLYREKNDLERKLRERSVSLSRRYFADPVHRLIYQGDMISADLLFGEAQRWMYFMLKAYEYKHNLDLNTEYPGGSGVFWDSKAVFRCRNADELAGLYQAMFTRDNLLNLGDRLDYDAISLRSDYFGYVDKDRFGTQQFYPDPISGQLVDAFTAFRSQLKISTNMNTVGANTVHMEFSSVRKFAGAPFFFLGPQFDANGDLINNDAGRYLDKIKSMRVSIPGTHTFGFNSLPGNLAYGGTSFIRKEHVGSPDPLQPSRLKDELKAYGTRYWFIDSSSATERWNFVESRRINGIPIDIVPVGSPAPVSGNIEEFKERSVATSRWELDIPLFSGSTQRLDINEINDIVIHIWHFSKSRVQ